MIDNDRVIKALLATKLEGKTLEDLINRTAEYMGYLRAPGTIDNYKTYLRTAIAQLVLQHKEMTFLAILKGDPKAFMELVDAQSGSERKKVSTGILLFVELQRQARLMVFE